MSDGALAGADAGAGLLGRDGMGIIDPGGIGTRAEWTAALQALRDQAGVSYDVLVERCSKSSSVSKSTLQQMVMGVSFPRASTVRLFVQACGVREVQPWVDARNRVAKGDVTLKRLRTPAGRQIRVGVVPRAADSFQDRQVAARLGEAAEQDGTVVLAQVVAGTGGVGKTQLAAAHARQAWRDGTGLLVWVNASSRDGIVAAYADAALALKLQGADREDAERSAQAFLAWAETTTSCWWLVVLDDVRRPGDLTGLWPPAAESAAAGQVLVTTRLREAALAGAGRRVVEVPVFTADEARAYLQAQLGDRAPGEDADALAAALGMLPLALAQASAYIRDADISVDRYLHRLATRLLREVVPEPGHLTDDHQRIISATWELSVDRADQVDPAGLARPVLYLASVLDPAGIPQSVLISPPSLDYLATYLPGPAGSTVLGHGGERVDADMVDRALRVLHRHSLIDHVRDAIHREVRVHQLVQRATRESLVTQPKLGPFLFAALTETAADALLAVWPAVEDDDLGQILRSNTAALNHAAGITMWNQDRGGHPVLFHAARRLGNSGQAGSAVAAYADLRTTAMQRLGPDHPDTLAARDNLAHWRGQAGDAAGAVAALEDLYADVLRVLGPDAHQALIVRDNLARWRGQAGDAAGAVAAYEQLLADMQRTLGPEHLHTLAVRINLAFSRGEAGDAVGAIAAYSELLADTLQALGPDHPNTLTVRHNTAWWMGRAGDFEGATAISEEVVAARMRVLA